MMIEERIEQLERIVRALHGKIGHKWYRGDLYFEKINSGRRECACGESELISLAEYDDLPGKWTIDEEW